MKISFLAALAAVVVACATASIRGQTADDILDQMTDDEKYSLLRGIGKKITFIISNSNIGINDFWWLYLYLYRHVNVGDAWIAFQLKDGYYIGNVPGVERLGIPFLKMHDGPQGFRPVFDEQIDQVTQWPSASAVSATFDADLVEEWADAIAKEFLAKGANVILGPAMDIARCPRAGRNAESLTGEDPAIGKILVPRYIVGIQKNKVLATMKHFDGYQQETFRMLYNSIIDNRTLWELYHVPFEAAVEAGVAATMCAYNRINGRYACQQPEILIDDLKVTMGFDGWVMSDWWATRSVVSALDGLDQDQPGAFPSFSPESLAANVPMERIDSMVLGILNKIVEFGLYNSTTNRCEPPNGCDYEIYEAQASTVDHQSLARRIATESIVLLKNSNNVLPINLDSVRPNGIALLGSACVPNNPSPDGSYYNIGGSGSVVTTRQISIFAGLQSALSGSGVNLYYDGSDNVTSALETAANSDFVILCGGTTTTEFLDRGSLDLDQNEFIIDVSQLLQTSTDLPIAVVMMTPGSVNTLEFVNNVDSIINIFLGGEGLGHAVADVLLGNYNPSGKLPVTFVTDSDVGPQPCLSPFDCIYTEGLYVGYRGYNSDEVSFPFGHGLSYTTYSYTFAANNNGCVDPLTVICFGVNVTNTGSRIGSETPQLYLTYPSTYDEPQRILKSFGKVKLLQPQQSAVTYLGLTERDISVWDDNDRDWNTARGTFTAYIGSSYTDIRLQQQFSY